MEQTATMYWIPRIHNISNPFCLIVASSSCSIKLLSKDAISVFKLLHSELAISFEKEKGFGIKTLQTFRTTKGIHKRKTTRSMNSSALYSSLLSLC